MATSAVSKQPRKAATETSGPLSADELKKMNAYWPTVSRVENTVRPAEITFNSLAF